MVEPFAPHACSNAAKSIMRRAYSQYGSARTFAQIPGLDGAMSPLEQTLEEEKKADKKLTRLAETMINDEALRAAPVQQH
jgi:ferritin-like metal-binding protein YciE